MKFLRYLKKFIGSLILLALIVAAVTFAVSNRSVVTFSLWPLPIEPSMQLGATVLAAFAIGLIAGTGIMAVSRMKSRRQARSSERRVASLEKVAQESSTTLPMPVAAAPEPSPRRVLSGQ
jgi:uncharacterized membrane protein YciS (DUF1049 family)